jgi:hypothetical protein
VHYWRNEQIQKPDVMLIMSDQQRADFFAREGSPLNTMPFLEHIAQPLAGQ